MRECGGPGQAGDQLYTETVCRATDSGDVVNSTVELDISRHTDTTRQSSQTCPGMQFPPFALKANLF